MTASHNTGNSSQEVEPQRASDSSTPAIVLTGGGARGAYQVGFLRCLAENLPEAKANFPIITGVSAGAINAAYLAARQGTFAEAVDDLVRLWTGLTPEKVFRVDLPCLARNVLRWGLRLVSGGSPAAPQVRGLLETTPLDRLLRNTLETDNGEIRGITENLDSGRLKAFALTTLNFSTGQTVTWVQGCELTAWERPLRRGVKTRITVDHVMASAALPLVFPAIQLDGNWYGDGGVRMYTPLAPAIHLGADGIVAISTRYAKDSAEAAQPVVSGYPPPAQFAGVLLNTIFLDAIDQDAQRLERINWLCKQLPVKERGDLRPIRLLTLRPSQDLGRLAGEFESQLPRAFRFMTRGLGTRETASPDFLSLLMFQPDYIRRLIELGERDAMARSEEIFALLES